MSEITLDATDLLRRVRLLEEIVSTLRKELTAATTDLAETKKELRWLQRETSHVIKCR